MNTNLSKPQFGTQVASVTRTGAMPIKDKFDGPAPLKESSVQNRMSPNINIRLPKPGFF